MNARFVVLSCVLGLAADVRADDDVSPPPPGRTRSLIAAVELELVDVEGAGGFRNRDPGVITPRVRAPTVDVDKATLTGALELEPRLRAVMELRADRTSARVDRVYLDATLVDSACWQVLAQAGRQKPMERPGPRHVETYAPLGNLFWRGREWHAGASVIRRAGSVELQAIGSVAMQRDLGVRVMGEDLNLPAIGFADAAVTEGAAVEVGGLVGVRAHGAYVAGFGFRGSLLDDSGYVRLEQAFTDDYEALSGGDTTNRTSHWYGARAGYDGHGAYVFGEAIFQRMGHAQRRGFELGGSYTFGVTLGRRRIELEPFVRWGGLYLTNLPEQFRVPESWDRRQLVTALLVRPSPSLELKVEYLFLGEKTDFVDDVPVRDNQLLIQLRLEKELL